MRGYDSRSVHGSRSKAGIRGAVFIGPDKFLSQKLKIFLEVENPMSDLVIFRAEQPRVIDAGS